MKNKKSLLRKYATIVVMSVTAIVFLPAACTQKSPEQPEEPVSGITMTTLASEVSFDISAGSGTITVDWGDGKKSDKNDAIYDALTDRLTFSHSYSSASEHRITVTDHNIASLTTKGTSKADSDTALITGLDCRRNQLTTLDVSSYTALIWLSCSDNQLTALDLSSNTALESLWCKNNQLATLDVSSNIALKVFDCSINQLTALDVTYNPGLMYLFCVYNQLTASALNDLFRTLHSNPIQGGKYIKVPDGPEAPDFDFSIAEEKGWIKFRESGRYP